MQIFKRWPFFRVDISSCQSAWLSNWSMGWISVPSLPLQSGALEQYTTCTTLCGRRVFVPPKFVCLENRDQSGLGEAPEDSERRLFPINTGDHLVSCFPSCRNRVAHPVPFRRSPLPLSPPTSYPLLVFETLSCPSLLHSCQTGNQINCVHTHSCNSCQVGGRHECSQPGTL